MYMYVDMYVTLYAFLDTFILLFKNHDQRVINLFIHFHTALR